MKLSAPKVVTFIIAVVLALLGVLGQLVTSIPLISLHPFYLLTIAFGLLVLGNLIKGL